MSTNTKPDNPETQSPDTASETDDNDAPSVEAEPESDSESEAEQNAEAETSADEDAEGTVDEQPVSGPPQQFQVAIKSTPIKEFVGTLRAIVDEAKFHIGPDGIQARAVDPANVAMDDIELCAAGFESYEASDGVLGLNLERLEEVLKLADKGDLVQMAFDTTAVKLVIHIDGVEFTMACIDPDSIRQEPDIPEMELPISFTVDEGQLKRGIKAADMVSDHISLLCDEANQSAHIIASGDTDNVDLELSDDDLIELTAVDGEAMFSLDYVKDIARKIPNNAEVSLTFGSDFPVKIRYEFADGEGQVLSMIAPRIRSD